MPFHVPAGHWILKRAPSASFPLTVVTDPVPPQVWDAAAVAMGNASPAATTAAENPMAATLLLNFTTTLPCETTVVNDASSPTVARPHIPA